jgi:hypothetical protein
MRTATAPGAGCPSNRVKPFPGTPGPTTHRKGWYRPVRWTFPGLFLLAIGLAGFGTLVAGH